LSNTRLLFKIFFIKPQNLFGISSDICFRYFRHNKLFALVIVSNVIVVFVMIAITRIIAVMNDVAQSAE